MGNGQELENIISKIKTRLDSIEDARDRALKKSRDIIRLSGKIITMVHAGKLDEATPLIREIEQAFEEFTSIIEEYPILKYAGFANNTLSEYVEAILFTKLLDTNKILSYEELKIEPAPYLLGLADLIGELKRHALELLRKDRIEEAWFTLDLMEKIYNSLKELDYPEALVPGLRHKVDVYRKVTEDLKKLLVDLTARQKLIKSLDKCRDTKAT